MRKHRFTISLLFGTCLVAFTGSTPQVRAAAATAQIPPLEPGMARVWFMRPTSDSIYNVGADPIIYVNGTPFGEMVVACAIRTSRSALAQSEPAVDPEESAAAAFGATDPIKSEST
jgi:hypothetical protein